jgi:hypothetical protein
MGSRIGSRKVCICMLILFYERLEHIYMRRLAERLINLPRCLEGTVVERRSSPSHLKNYAHNLGGLY